MSIIKEIFSVETEKEYHAITRYLLFLIIYNVFSNSNNLNICSINRLILYTQFIDVFDQSDKFLFCIIDYYNKHKSFLFSIVNLLIENRETYYAYINSKLNKIMIDNITSIIKYILLLSYFEINILVFKKQMVISDYLTILNVIGFTRKEIGFTNKIIDLF